MKEYSDKPSAVAMRKWRANNTEKARDNGRRDAAKWRGKYPDAVKKQNEEYFTSGRKAHADKLSKAKARARNREYLAIVKSEPCTRCGERFHPAAMEFHHLDPANKIAAVATIAGWGRTLDVLVAEIAKCVLLCANCHKIETWGHIYGQDAILRSTPPREDRRRRGGDGRSEEDIGESPLPL